MDGDDDMLEWCDWPTAVDGLRLLLEGSTAGELIGRAGDYAGRLDAYAERQGDESLGRLADGIRGAVGRHRFAAPVMEGLQDLYERARSGGLRQAAGTRDPAPDGRADGWPGPQVLPAGSGRPADPFAQGAGPTAARVMAETPGPFDEGAPSWSR